MNKSITLCVLALSVVLNSVHAYGYQNCLAKDNCQLETGTSIHFPLEYNDKNQHCQLYQLGHYDKSFWLITKTIAAIGLYVCPNTVNGKTEAPTKKEGPIPAHKIRRKPTASDVGHNLFILLKPYISRIPNGMYRSYFGNDITAKGKMLKLGKKQLDLIIEVINKSIKTDLEYGDEISIRMNPFLHEQIIVDHKHRGSLTQYTREGFPNNVFVKLFRIFKDECVITYDNKSIKL